ncbi:hypothetical protein BD626DRAFT_632821 [Schizophyllum amplum]|uniref:Uncharacterized protein n=1 Tax=Schizophyllum amplum TaxID=97359 RepID=A0A550C5H0_9AGAR|nr:hypothetical protein BD626DRAFT_632821 [Auriculariopsis ampla]
MWSKITGAFKPGKGHDEHEHLHPQPQPQPDVLGRVLDQHPNMSVFHQPPDQHPRPESPSKLGLRGVFKRPAKQPEQEYDSMRSPSPFKLPGAFTQKVTSHMPFQNGNASQASIGRNGERPHIDGLGRPSQEKGKKRGSMRRASIDLLRHSPSLDILRPRPSVEALRAADPDHFDGRPQGPRSPTAPPSSTLPGPFTIGEEANYGSVRSIMREPNTPGTGQNVRFFSRNAYLTISPDTSMDSAIPQPVQDVKFMERLQRASGSQTLPAILSPKGRSRPGLGSVFSPLQDQDGPAATNPFDMSQEIHLPPMPPPGLSLAMDIQTQLPEMSADLTGAHGMTSTPAAKGKCKQKEELPVVDLSDSTKELPQVPIIPESGPPAENIFHAQEKAPRLPSLLHERSQSFSFGQTLYHSMVPGGDSKRNSKSSDKSDTTHRSSVASSEVAYSSSDVKSGTPSSRPTDSPASSTSAKSRSRAFSDTRFYSMMRSSPVSSRSIPELDINDESSADIVVSPEPAPQPDPFNAHANTSSMHSRKTSKEDALICSLQTQLALQTELVGQYETDLRARDETVLILERRIQESEKEEGRRRATLRAMRKKVLELEKHVRYLEEEVDSSQQVSMERSIMDEASGQALRTLHRQIADLEREKDAMMRREDALHDEVNALQHSVRERADEVEELRETLRKRDEHARELQAGITSAREQMEQMGNISICVDEDELRRLASERENRDDAAERRRAAEFQWQEERSELLTRTEGLVVERDQLREEKERLREEYDAKCAQLHTRDEEYTTLRAELEAQWDRTEKMTAESDELKKKMEEVEEERDNLKAVVEDLEQKITSMEVEWTESENKRNEFEAEAQELWEAKEGAEKDKEELEHYLSEERHHIEELERAMADQQDRIGELERECEFSNESASRVQELIRQRDVELTQISQQLTEQKRAAEDMQEQMSTLKREHTRALEEQGRALSEAAGQEGQTKKQFELLLRQKAEADVEVSTSKDRLAKLQEELEKLRRHVHELQQDSADKEMKLMQLTKQRGQDKDEITSLNIALEAKQQEVDLIKRRTGTRASVGTPAAAKTGAHRRESSIFSTPTLSRPASALSEASSTASASHDRKGSAESISTGPRMSALAKTTRPTNASSKGAMGPPVGAKPRASFAGTPTPAPRSSLARSTASKPASATAPHRRVPSGGAAKSLGPKLAASVSSISETSETDEKENKTISQTPRRTMVPTPA